MSVKQYLYVTLKEKNYFDMGKKDSLAVFERTQNLEDVLIEVERGCNVDHLLFKYNPKTKKFHRVTLTDADKKLLKRDCNCSHTRSCVKRKCFARAIDIESFIKLLDSSFEPIAIYHVTERLDVFEKYHK